MRGASKDDILLVRKAIDRYYISGQPASTARADQAHAALSRIEEYEDHLEERLEQTTKACLSLEYKAQEQGPLSRIRRAVEQVLTHDPPEQAAMATLREAFDEWAQWWGVPSLPPPIPGEYG